MSITFIRPSTTSETTTQPQNQPVTPTSSSQFQQQMEEASTAANSPLQTLRQNRALWNSMPFTSTQFNLTDNTLNNPQAMTMSTNRWDQTSSKFANGGEIPDLYSPFSNMSPQELFGLIQAALRYDPYGDDANTQNIPNTVSVSYNSKYGIPESIKVEGFYPTVDISISDFMGAGASLNPPVVRGYVPPNIITL